MQLPVRLLVGTGCLVAAVAANRLRQGKKSSKGRSQPHDDSAVDATKQLVHAYASPSPSVSGVQQISPAAVAPSPGGAVGLLVMYTSLVCSAAVAAALRGQWDLVAAFAVAWLLVILGKVLYGPQYSSLYAAGKLPEAESAAVHIVSPVPIGIQDLAGTWIKDGSACDTLDPAMDMLHVNGIVRTGAKLIKGVKITLDDEKFSFGVFSVISWFKITENYQLNGELAHNRRRDFRRGKHHGTAKVTSSGSIRLEYQWEDPQGGTGVDEFLIDEEGRLNVVTKLTVKDRTEGYTLRYHRK